jgi:hypothetical protein
MFQGTMIDELIQSVERAEQKARERQRQTTAEMDLQRFPLHMVNWRQVTEVA